MIKLAIFDIDGTLAEVGRPIAEENIALLKQIEELGVTVGISSGKSVFYQMGMFRQVGLRTPVFIGENGCSIAMGSRLPPETISLPVPEEYSACRAQILTEISERFRGHFWLQPNEVMLTFFFRDEETRDGMRDFFAVPRPEITVYEHIDSFDVLPRGIDKFVSLAALCKRLGIVPEECIAVGDGANDLPMIDFCSLSVGIGNLDPACTTFHFGSIHEGLQKILRMVKHDRKV